MDDEQLGLLIDAATPLGSGIGGTTVRLDVAGVPVFVKRVPLTEVERHPSSIGATTNVFGLPMFCHYGIGSPGFGAWRELAAHVTTTAWVLSGDCACFPLLYHWRILPSAHYELPDELRNVEDAVAYWEGSPAMRTRIEALAAATDSVVLFLEYVPQTLSEWLGERLAIGGSAADSAVLFVERELAAGTAAMNGRELLHLDAHFDNILTDGRQLYFADFGLALSSEFDLAPDEAAFFEEHRNYDRSYTTVQLVDWLIGTVYGCTRAERADLLRACVGGRVPTAPVSVDTAPPAELPSSAALFIVRQARLALIMNEFSRQLLTESRLTPYPADQISQVLAAD